MRECGNEEDREERKVGERKRSEKRKKVKEENQRRKDEQEGREKNHSYTHMEEEKEDLVDDEYFSDLARENHEGK
jgi:hypothetical protein